MRSLVHWSQWKSFPDNSDQGSRVNTTHINDCIIVLLLLPYLKLLEWKHNIYETFTFQLSHQSSQCRQSSHVDLLSSALPPFAAAGPWFWSGSVLWTEHWPERRKGEKGVSQERNESKKPAAPLLCLGKKKKYYLQQSAVSRKQIKKNRCSYLRQPRQDQTIILNDVLNHIIHDVFTFSF